MTDQPSLPGLTRQSIVSSQEMDARVKPRIDSSTTNAFVQNRRAFITLIAGVAAAWPLPARAQSPAVRTIGYLSPRAADVEKEFLTAFRQGLSETRSRRGQKFDRRVPLGRWSVRPPFYPGGEPVRRQVSVIATTVARAARQRLLRLRQFHRVHER